MAAPFGTWRLLMNVFEFGDAKLRLKDIDPLYWAVHNAGMDEVWKCAYTVAFVTFDLAGLAASITDTWEGGKRTWRAYWGAMHMAVDQTKRGAPRRYFRGQVAHEALYWLEARYGNPVKMLAALKGTFNEAEAEMKAWPQFGPTAYFKLADMAERVCGVPIDFEVITPKQLMSNVQVTKGVVKALEDMPVLTRTAEDLFESMRRYKWATKAGPGYDRKLGMQEFETILCYYSHDDAHNRHMPGMDIHNIAAELGGWGATADKLQMALPWQPRNKRIEG